jgi:DNA-binding transcriptional MerR regulator
MTGKTYRISELAQALGTTARTIRHYESEGLLKPARIGGARLYSERDKKRILAVLKGVRVGFSLATLRELLGIRDLKSDASTQQLVDALKLFEDRIADLQRQKSDIESLLIDLHETKAKIELALADKGHRMHRPGRPPNMIGYGLQPPEE